MKCCLGVLGMAPILLFAQDWEAVRALRARETHHAETPVQAAKARPKLRNQLERALGLGQMPWPPSLRARTVGALARNWYRIEKIVYEALPGESVAAHVYLPEHVRGPAPAILFYNGHWWAESKMLPDFQVFCITMARYGFFVLRLDPFGQGERGASTRPLSARVEPHTLTP
jgi:dipeptidyl aminopeptidase/acylaminoacyl peptidase